MPGVLLYLYTYQYIGLDGWCFNAIPASLDIFMESNKYKKKKLFKKL